MGSIRVLRSVTLAILVGLLVAWPSVGTEFGIFGAETDQIDAAKPLAPVPGRVTDNIFGNLLWAP
jgi:hypothetical protein